MAWIVADRISLKFQRFSIITKSFRIIGNIRVVRPVVQVGSGFPRLNLREG